MKKQVIFLGGDINGQTMELDTPLPEKFHGYVLHIGGVDNEEHYVYDTITPKEKSLGNTCANGATKNVKDIVFWGDGDTFQLISKASSANEGWMKSTKAMDCDGSVVVQVTTQQRNPDGSYSVAEALTTVPDACIMTIWNKDNTEVIGRRIVSNIADISQ